MYAQMAMGSMNTVLMDVRHLHKMVMHSFLLCISFLLEECLTMYSPWLQYYSTKGAWWLEECVIVSMLFASTLVHWQTDNKVLLPDQHQHHLCKYYIYGYKCSRYYVL